MTDTPRNRQEGQQKDWVRQAGSFALAWGLPIALLVGAVFLDPSAKSVVWAAALSWMGMACLLNARRCGRIHCYLIGPFFLVIGFVALLHGFDIVPLGPAGWRWLGLTLGIGGALLWCLPEMIWGKYANRSSDTSPPEA